MPPENVRCPPSPWSKNYVKNTLKKCYDRPKKASKVLEEMTKKNGFRCYYITETGLYRGWWKDNKRHGVGTQYDNKTKEIFEGDYINDKRSGYGVISRLRPSGIRELVYDGEFADGAPNGRGELHTDTYHFKGRIVDGKASGVGIAWYKTGQIYFGNWFRGKRMGQGMLILKNRDRYEGSWYNDQKHGYGQYCFFQKGQALEGIWVADVCIRGIMRNIKYRQAAIDPIQYPLPKLMLKDWESNYYNWEKEAFAIVGRYVREDFRIEDLQEEEMKTPPASEQTHDTKTDDEDPLIHKMDFLRDKLSSDSLTAVQLCVLLEE